MDISRVRYVDFFLKLVGRLFIRWVFLPFSFLHCFIYFSLYFYFLFLFRFSWWYLLWACKICKNHKWAIESCLFGKKFQIAVRKIEQWYVQDIKKIIEACVILHNMMVEERMDWGEQEGSGWYEYREEGTQEQEEALDPAMEHVERQEAEMHLHRQLQEFFYTGPAINISDQNYQQQWQLFNIREMAINRRWDMLHDGR